MGEVLRTHTPLGALIRHRGLKVGDVIAGANVPRQHMSEYLSGRRQLRKIHRIRLAEFFDIDEEKLLTPSETITASLALLGRTRNWDHS